MSCSLNIFVIYLLCLAIPCSPSAPTISDITSTGCRLKYKPPSVQVGGPPVTGYFLQVRTSLNGPWIRVNHTLITETETVVKKLQADSWYEFRLAAVNDYGLSEYSTSSDAVVPVTENRPSQPSRLVTTDSGSSYYKIIIAILYTAHYSCPYKFRSRHLTVIFSALVISTVNHGPPVGLYAETLVAE